MISCVRAYNMEPRQKILLVEDYPPNIMVAGAYLDHFGLGYDVAINGVEAVKLIKSNECYHLVLMDLQMPELDGLNATRQIREYEAITGIPRHPIIGLTAQARQGDKLLCLDAGMDDYITKPYSLHILKEKMRDWG
jgi:CheY-like chemotaxis protein